MEEFTFNPELQLEPQEISELASIYGQPGFLVINKIYRLAVDSFVKELINADGANEKDVIARHNQAKTAAQLYTKWLQTVNHIVYQYTHSVQSDKPIDAAQGLDFGETEEESVI